MSVLARVLCVDDEPRVLEGLERILGESFEVVTASSGAEGLERLAAFPDIAVVTSDMRMPGRDGATFLAQARALNPDARAFSCRGRATSKTPCAPSTTASSFAS